MKLIIEGTVTDLGGIKLSDIKNVYVFISTDIALVARPLEIEKLLTEK